MDLIFAYAAGLLTLINPCVLPILPIVLASALNADRRGPIALAAGLGVAFVIVGIGVNAFGAAIGLDDVLIGQIAAALMVVFGLVLVTPRLGAAFATATAGVANRADAQLNDVDGDNLRGQFLTGVLLGAVWSPCVGPTLGAAIALASQRAELLWVTAVMIAFALGVATFIIGLGMGAREAISKRSAKLRGIAERSKPILGAVLIAVGAALLFGLHHRIEAWLLDVMPIWLQDLSVSL